MFASTTVGNGVTTHKLVLEFRRDNDGILDDSVEIEINGSAIHLEADELLKVQDFINQAKAKKRFAEV